MVASSCRRASTSKPIASWLWSSSNAASEASLSSPFLPSGHGWYPASRTGRVGISTASVRSRGDPDRHLHIRVERAFRASVAGLASRRTNTPRRARRRKLQEDSTSTSIRSADECLDRMQTERRCSASSTPSCRRYLAVRTSTAQGAGSIPCHQDGASPPCGVVTAPFSPTPEFPLPLVQRRKTMSVPDSGRPRRRSG